MGLQKDNTEEIGTKISKPEFENDNLNNNEQQDVTDKVKLLLAKLSHELKTPLNSIIGFAELIKYKTNDEKLMDYSCNILNSSNYMLSLIKNIIDITTSQYKPIELNYSFFKSKDTIEDIIKSFKDVKFKYTLVDFTICADYTRFSQLVNNLISNAVKFNKPDSDIIIITYLNDGKFCFEISDNGDGIDVTNYEKIFDIFTRIPDNQGAYNVGSGIGLALCKTIVNAHGGEISVFSENGKGSTFIFQIPIDFQYS